MTLCITAACQHKDDPAIVFLTDTRSQSSARGWEHAINLDDADKSRTIGEFSASIAGDPTLGDELLTMCEIAIRAFTAAPDGDDLDLHMNDLLEGLRVACRQRKKQIQDHLVGMTTPFKDLDEFLAKARDTLPKDQYREVWRDLRTMHLGAEIILGGFHCGESIIIKIGLDGEPKWIDQIAVIGTGSAEALAFFAQNEYDETEVQSQDCLMRVFEATSFVSRANKTVSQTSRFEVRILGKQPADITEEFFELMESKIRLRNPVSMGEVGEFLKYDEDEEPAAVSSAGGQETAAQESGVSSTQQPSGSGVSGSENGDSSSGS